MEGTIHASTPIVLVTPYTNSFGAGSPEIAGYAPISSNRFKIRIQTAAGVAKGSAFSFVFIIAIFGNTSMNYLMGIIAEKSGIDKYPLVLLICASFLLLIAVLKLPKIVNQKNN